MSLQNQIQQDLKAAMLARDADKTSTLRLLKSALGYAQIEAKTDLLPDPAVLSLLQKEIKKRRDAIEQYEQGARPELAQKERREIAILEAYLPQPLSPQELETLVRSVIQELGATGKKDMGSVIRTAQQRAAGRADGKAISGVAARLLS